MALLIRLWKPFGMLSQFTDPAGRRTLAELLPVPDVYPAGRLDRDSEGLLLLTDSGALQARISGAAGGMQKTYQVLVEGAPDTADLARLCAGVTLNDGPARALKARPIAPPALPARDPPPQPRSGRPTAWLELVLDEGRNRQVRRMCAAIGTPVLRLVRVAVGPWTLAGLAPGEWAEETLHAPVTAAQGPRRPRPHGQPSRTRSSGRRPDKSRASRTPRGS